MGSGACPIKKEREVTTMNEALMNNTSVRELLAILDRNHTDAGGLLALLGYVNAAERQLDTVAAELREMRHELSVIREERNHPLRAALQRAQRSLETKINAAREKLNEVKNAIIQGCKKAVIMFKRYGITALSNLAAFFRVGPMLEAMKKSLTESIASSEKAIRRIDTISAKYHQAGLHMKNAGRALRGKETIQDAKPIGRLAKLAKSPFAAYINQMKYALSNVKKAIAGLERLNRSAHKLAEEKSILQTLNVMKERAHQTQQAAPAQAAEKRRDVSL